MPKLIEVIVRVRGDKGAEVPEFKDLFGIDNPILNVPKNMKFLERRPGDDNGVEVIIHNYVFVPLDH